MDTIVTILLVIAAVLSVAAAIKTWATRKPLDYKLAASLFAVTALFALLLATNYEWGG